MFLSMIWCFPSLKARKIRTVVEDRTKNMALKLFISIKIIKANIILHIWTKHRLMILFKTGGDRLTAQLGPAGALELNLYHITSVNTFGP